MLVNDLGDGFKCIDKSIYEPRRIIRILNTRHGKSGLFKIPLTISELNSYDMDKIRELAKNPREIIITPADDIPVNRYLSDIYTKCIEKCSREPQKQYGNYDDNAKSKPLNRKYGNKIDLLENVQTGYRHSSAIRITGYLREKGLSDSMCAGILNLWNKSNNEPLPDEEINTIIRSTNKWNKQPATGVYNIIDILELYAEFRQHSKERMIHTGYEIIDDMFRCMIPGEVFCIQAGSGMCKTTLALNMLANYVKTTGKPAIFFSMEMPSSFYRSGSLVLNLIIPVRKSNKNLKMHTKPKFIFRIKCLS